MKTPVEHGTEHTEAQQRERREDRQRWEEYKRTGEHIDHESMMAWLKELESGH
jgi:predicted transcriptional regulator